MHTRRVLRRLAAAPRWLLGLAIIGVFVAIALLPQGREGLFGRLEAIAYDARLATTLGKGGDPQVVIVDIDEASLRQQGRWPWSRDKVLNASSTTPARRSKCLPPIAPNLLSMPSTRSALLSSRPLHPQQTGTAPRRSRRNNRDSRKV